MTEPTTPTARVGVFVCDCGSNIAGVVDVPSVVEYARTLPQVVLADEGRWSCSVDYLNRFKELIQEHRLDRVVVASCTPRTHEPLFKASVREAGLNPYLLEFVSIREQASWVHMREPELATAKAKDLVRMGVAKAVLLEEGEEIRLTVGTDCLVLGGGMTGMTAALHVAEQGFQVILVEREAELGGLLRRVRSVQHHHQEYPAEELLAATRARVAQHPGIQLRLATELVGLEGYIGNYRATLRPTADEEAATETAAVSTIIVATGMEEIPPEGQYGHGEDPRVMTQLQLEEVLRAGEAGEYRHVVMISCVGSRNERRGCCTVGCLVSVKNALALRRLQPDCTVHVLYRDLNLLREEAFLAEEARALGVRFLRFPEDRYPEVTPEGELLQVRVWDIPLGEELVLPADLLVLATAFQGDETVARLKGLLKVSASADGFFQEAHIKLGPLDFPADGLALAGCARSPHLLRESLEEGVGAAMRVSIPMRQGHIEAEGIVAAVDQESCTRCGLCAKQCPYGAIQVDEEQVPTVLGALCKGCGLCAADCPAESISIVHYTDAQLRAQVEAALTEDPGQKILGFVCHWCALGGVDMAGVSRLQYPACGRLIRVMCSARVPISLVERAFELGAAGVLVAGCEFPTCHYITGNYACEKRMKRARKKLARQGHDPERLWNVWCSAADGPKFARTMREMAAQLGLASPTEVPTGG